jgi:hypothetical protein
VESLEHFARGKLDGAATGDLNVTPAIGDYHLAGAIQRECQACFQRSGESFTMCSASPLFPRH